MAKKDYGTVMMMAVPSGEKKKTKKDYGTATAMQIPSGWKKNERGTLKGGLAEYNRLKNKYGTAKGGLIDSDSLTVWDDPAGDAKAAQKRKDLVKKIEGSTRRETVGLRTKGKVYRRGTGFSTRSADYGSSSQPHPFSGDKGFKFMSTEKDVKYPLNFKVPVRMRDGFSTYSPEKDKERVLKKVYDGMYVYGKQKKKK